jgi:hypothetical protein
MENRKILRLFAPFPFQRWLRHINVNGSLYNDAGGVNVDILQSCTIDGICRREEEKGEKEEEDNGNVSYFIDEPEVGRVEKTNS